MNTDKKILTPEEANSLYRKLYGHIWTVKQNTSQSCLGGFEHYAIMSQRIAEAHYKGFIAGLEASGRIEVKQ